MSGLEATVVHFVNTGMCVLPDVLKLVIRCGPSLSGNILPIN